MARRQGVVGLTTIAHIDLAAFEHNVASIVSTSAPASVWVAIKSNAYGHGMLELADNALKAGATGFAVLDIPAALRLRSHGITSTVFAWLHGVDSDFESAVVHEIDLGVSSLEQLEAIASVRGVGRVHLKIDTGLHRNGVSESDWERVCRRAAELESAGEVSIVGIWSHLADAGTDADTDALSKFDAAIETARNVGVNPLMTHIAASSAALSTPNARRDVVRVGIAAYGISPLDDVDGRGLGLRPVLTLSGTVSDSSGDESIVASGWNDGVPLVIREGSWVAVNGAPARVRVVAPQFTVVEGAWAIGSRVDIVGGDGPTAEQWAAWSGTIGDEIVTRIPTHVRRVFVRN